MKIPLLDQYDRRVLRYHADTWSAFRLRLFLSGKHLSRVLKSLEPAFIQNTATILSDPFARFCFFRGITEEEKQRIFKLALRNPFTHIEIARFYLKAGRDFEKLEIALEAGRDVM